MEIIANSTADAPRRLQTEMESLEDVVFQNHVVLDMITAQIGEVCTLINARYCAYIDLSKQITLNIHTIWKHTRVLHEVTRDDTACLTSLWNMFTSWLPDFSWLKQFVFVAIMTVVCVLMLHICSNCLFTLCK